MLWKAGSFIALLDFSGRAKNRITPLSFVTKCRRDEWQQSQKSESRENPILFPRLLPLTCLLFVWKMWHHNQRQLWSSDLSFPRDSKVVLLCWKPSELAMHRDYHRRYSLPIFDGHICKKTLLSKFLCMFRYNFSVWDRWRSEDSEEQIEKPNFFQIGIVFTACPLESLCLKVSTLSHYIRLWGCMVFELSAITLRDSCSV